MNIIYIDKIIKIKEVGLVGFVGNRRGFICEYIVLPSVIGLSYS